MPPEREARPVVSGTGSDRAGDKIETSLADHDAEDRQGLKRVTVARSTSGRCHNCSRVFETLAGAVSHGRSAQHLVEANYSVRYLYVPIDGGGRRG